MAVPATIKLKFKDIPLKNMGFKMNGLPSCGSYGGIPSISWKQTLSKMSQRGYMYLIWEVLNFILIECAF